MSGWGGVDKPCFLRAEGVKVPVGGHHVVEHATTHHDAKLRPHRTLDSESRGADMIPHALHSNVTRAAFRSLGVF